MQWADTAPALKLIDCIEELEEATTCPTAFLQDLMQREPLGRALAVQERVFGPELRDVAVACADLGNAYGPPRDAAKQQGFWRGRWLSMSEVRPRAPGGGHHPRRSWQRLRLPGRRGQAADASGAFPHARLCRLGARADGTPFWVKAAGASGEALAIDESEYGPDHREVGITLANLGNA